MTDLAKQAAEHLTRIVWGDFADPEEGVADIIRSHGTLVSHEDAAWLALARCPDPLTLDAAVKVMGREPDDVGKGINWQVAYWDKYPNGVEVWYTPPTMRIRAFQHVHDNPTVGQFASLVAAAKMGGKT